MSARKPFGENESTDAEPPSIAKDDLFHLLQNSRRRAVLRYFFTYPKRNEFNMRDIAEEIAAWENDISIDQLHSNQRQRVYIALYQSHLPKLADYGVVEYDQSRGTVKPTPLTALFEPYVESEFRTTSVDQQVSIPDDHSTLGFSKVRSLLDR